MNIVIYNTIYAVLRWLHHGYRRMMNIAPRVWQAI